MLSYLKSYFVIVQLTWNIQRTEQSSFFEGHIFYLFITIVSIKTVLIVIIMIMIIIIIIIIISLLVGDSAIRWVDI